MTEQTWHCQICARAIKAKSGLIAHHGYQRPGDGWQTASCMGAKFGPYELACDRIQSAIDAVTAHIKKVEDYLPILHAGPETLGTMDGYPKKYVEYTRPEGFNPEKNKAGTRPRTYENAWAHKWFKSNADLRGSRETLKFLQDRLGAWVAP